MSICLSVYGFALLSVTHTSHYIIFKGMGYISALVYGVAHLCRSPVYYLTIFYLASILNSLSMKPTRFDTFLFTTLTSRKNIKWILSHRQTPITQLQIVSTSHGGDAHTTQIFRPLTGGNILQTLHIYDLPHNIQITSLLCFSHLSY